jgi:hypothetical protein
MKNRIKKTLIVVIGIIIGLLAMILTYSAESQV